MHFASRSVCTSSGRHAPVGTAVGVVVCGVTPFVDGPPLGVDGKGGDVSCEGPRALCRLNSAVPSSASPQPMATASAEAATATATASAPSHLVFINASGQEVSVQGLEHGPRQRTWKREHAVNLR